MPVDANGALNRRVDELLFAVGGNRDRAIHHRLCRHKTVHFSRESGVPQNSVSHTIPPAEQTALADQQHKT
jgi:hypothetical protein